MTGSVKPITILGAGKMGFAAALLLKQAGDYRIVVVDHDENQVKALAALGFEVVLANDDASLVSAVSGRYAVLNALPFHRDVSVASMCARSENSPTVWCDSLCGTKVMACRSLPAHDSSPSPSTGMFCVPIGVSAPGTVDQTAVSDC